MNSDIPTVLKLSPVTVVKTDKQQVEPRLSISGAEEKGIRALGSSNNLQASISNTVQEKVNGAKDAGSNFSLETVKKAVDEGNSFLQAVTRDLQFKVDETTDKLVIKVVDSGSGKIVRQIPSEEMLAFIKRMQELEGQQGLMIQDRA